MKITLGKKLFLFTSGTLVVLLLATFLVLERSQSKRWEEYLRAQSISFASFATPELLKLFRGNFPPGGSGNLTSIYELLALNRDLIRFSFHSTGGKLLFQSPPLPDFIDSHVDPVDGPAFLSRLHYPEATIRTIVPPDGGRVLDLIVPAFGPTGEHVLSVRYLISYGSVDARLTEMRQQFLRIALVSIFCTLVLVALVARRVTRPIQELTAGARAIARGDLATRIATRRGDEIGALGAAFNEMAESLAANREELTTKHAALLLANQELQEMQEHLLRTERLAATGQLAAGVSHEIDNPVGIILGYAELLLEDLAPEDPRRPDVLAIIEECKRCRRITGGLLGFARLTPARRELVSLNALAASTLATLRPQKLFKEIDCQFIPAPVELYVDADADQLRQVLVNLLLNAAQAMAGKGRVSLEISGGDKALLSVCDTGPGIPAELMERIFEPFFSTKEKGEGTGLGLPVCRKLAEVHGGRLWVEAGLGGGACFRVQLPLAGEEKSFDKGPAISIG